MMRLPAFSAEISFYKGSKQYHAARGSNDEAHGRLLPALSGVDDPENISSIPNFVRGVTCESG